MEVDLEMEVLSFPVEPVKNVRVEVDVSSFGPGVSLSDWLEKKSSASAPSSRGSSSSCENPSTPPTDDITISHKQPDIISHKPDIISHKQPDIISHKPADIISHKQADIVSHKQADIVSRKEAPLLLVSVPKSAPPRPPTDRVSAPLVANLSEFLVKVGGGAGVKALREALREGKRGTTTQGTTTQGTTTQGPGRPTPPGQPTQPGQPTPPGQPQKGQPVGISRSGGARQLMMTVPGPSPPPPASRPTPQRPRQAARSFAAAVVAPVPAVVVAPLPSTSRLLTAVNSVRAVLRVKRAITAGSAPKIFCIHGTPGNARGVREVMEARGWTRNEDNASEEFVLKWADSAVKINYDTLHRVQAVNHFRGNGVLTTKAGLAESVEGAKWRLDVDPDSFFPRCYILSRDEGLGDFVDFVRFAAAEAVLKLFLKRVVGGAGVDDDRARAVTDEMANVAVDVIEGRLLVREGAVADDDAGGDGDLQRAVIKRREAGAEMLVSNQVLFPRRKDEAAAVAGRRSTRPTTAAASNGPSSATAAPSTRPSTASSQRPVPPNIVLDPGFVMRQQQTSSSSTAAAATSSSALLPEAPSQPSTSRAALLAQAAALPQLSGRALEEKAREMLRRVRVGDPQADLRGDHNAWIVKPVGKSRGRGIECFASLHDITEYITGTEERYVAQKYIENPLLVKGRKFDLRVWVTVTSWNPLVCYEFAECYVRFCQPGFTLDSWDDKFMHLANNAVQKYGPEFDTDKEFDHNIWHIDDLARWFEQTGRGDFGEVRESVTDLILTSLKLGEHVVQDHECAFELYGFDVMLDDRLTPWLIEINENPSLETESPVLAGLVPKALDDLIGFVVDPATRKTPNLAGTGRWRLISDPSAKKVAHKVTHGVELCVKGEKKKS